MKKIFNFLFFVPRNSTAWLLALLLFSSASLYADPKLTPVITTAVTSEGIPGMLGQPFNYKITADKSPISYGASNLPAGLSLDVTTGVISGIPTTAGTYKINLSASRAKGTPLIGNVVAWGDNQYGQTTVPTGLTGVTKIAAGGEHTVALKSDGTVVAWGANTWGQTTVPTGLTGVTKIDAGPFHTVALKSDGTVVPWGQNTSGQNNVPAGLTNLNKIDGGGNHTVALKSDGKWWRGGIINMGRRMCLPG